MLIVKLKSRINTAPTPYQKSLKSGNSGKRRYEKVIYISHPYGGKKENEEKVAKIINRLQKQYPTYLFISPIHAFSFQYHKVDYEVGIQKCLWLLYRCDEMWVFGDWENSKGVCREILECEKINKPYSIYKGCEEDCIHCPVAYFDDGGIYCGWGGIE